MGYDENEKKMMRKTRNEKKITTTNRKTKPKTRKLLLAIMSSLATYKLSHSKTHSSIIPSNFYTMYLLQHS